MATTTNIPDEPKEPFFKKYSAWIIATLAVALLCYVVYNLSHKNSATITVVKRDTVVANYLAAPFGQAPAAAVLEDHLSDGSIMYEVPMGLDTVKGKDGLPVLDTVRNGNQIIMDTTKDKFGVVLTDSAHHPLLHPKLAPKMTVHLEYRLPKYVSVLPISPR